MLTISIVSHGQGKMIGSLLNDLSTINLSKIFIIITINIPEDESFLEGIKFPIYIVRNKKPKGFGANHNFAASVYNSIWFAVVNPDIRVKSLDIKQLLKPFNSHEVAAVAPIVLSNIGNLEDSFRRFPTLFSIIKRIIFRNRNRNTDYPVVEDFFTVDWVAGMFIVFDTESFKSICGFDERRFFMYLEDVDICKRLNMNGKKIIINPKVSVIHNAQRASHKNVKYLWWHTKSMVRFLSGF